MAHFAELDENNIVVRVIVVTNDCCKDSNGNEQEDVGIAFCQSLLGGLWKQTSYNGKFRKNYAGIGYTYDPVRDAFIPPKPFDSWVLDEDTCTWNSPVPMPVDAMYEWDESSLTWVKTSELPQ